MIQLQTKFSDQFWNFQNKELVEKTETAYRTLTQKTGSGKEFLGWIHLPSSITKEQIQKIQTHAKRFREQSDVVVVVGIGGSYLGSRAVIEALQNPFGTKKPEIIFAGNQLSPEYHHDLLKYLEKKDFSVNVISKSGTTTEPALAFRLLVNLLIQKYGEAKLKDRIIATTDSAKGALKKLATEKSIPCFDIPDDVGGRFSVLTPVGLLPIAIANFGIEELVNGAKSMESHCLQEKKIEANLAMKYSYIRNHLYSSGKKVEVMVNYLPNLHYITEWWKQLYGESEGKQGKGIFPAGVDLTTDLHSMGQYLQDGERHLFETILSVSQSNSDLQVEEWAGDPDGLNFLSGKKFSYINQKAKEGTLVAHHDGKVPCTEIVLDKLNEYTIGELFYFFEFGCGISGYTLGVNPFDQPGVEDYKQNMFALLGKKGFESRKQELEKFFS